MRSVLIALFFLCLAATSHAAQTVRGRVVEEGSGRAVIGGFVALLDDEGAQRGASLTNEGGHFQIVAPAAGRYRLGVDRIGYLSVVTPLFPVPEGRTVEYQLTVRVEPVELSGIDVRIDPVCHVRPGEGLASARVWEEAYKALNATAWTQREGLLRYTVAGTERTLDPWTLRVVEERARTRRGVSRGSPYVAVDIDVLSREGFARVEGERQTYYAPDAGTLLSGWFLDHHCFRLVPSGEGDAGLVGLAFEPVSEEDKVDIRGTLWLDERTAELSHIEFTYTGLPAAIGKAEAGGRVEFDRLPSGEWIVPRWRMRMPVVRWPDESPYSHLGMDPSRRVPTLLAFEEDGGEVVQVVSLQSPREQMRSFPSEPIPFEPPAPAPALAEAPLQRSSEPIVVEPLEVVLEEPLGGEVRARGESRYVITAGELLAHPGLPLGAILERRIPGLRHLVRGTCSTLRTRNGLVRLVVLDGQRIYDTCVLELVQPQDVERIEFLPSMAASIEYGEVRGGGVLIVETHRGGGR